MNDLIIIHDVANHAHKSLYATKFSSKKRMLETITDQHSFIKKMTTDFAFIMRMLGQPNQVIMTLDERSWRKDIDMLEQNTGYKANRVKDNNVVNWDAFNELTSDFLDILSKNGFTKSVLKGCEGDDLMFFWAEKFYQQGDCVIICSGDGDITQLNKYSENNFICCFNTKSTSRQVIGAPGFGDWLKKRLNEPANAFDIFMTSNYLSSPLETINSLINQTKLVEIDPNEVLFEKIVCGDAGDNIPAILTWETTQKNGKIINNKISPLKAALIKEKILDKGNGCDVRNLSQYADIFVKEIKNIYDKDIDKITIQQRLERNTTLVLLSKQTIPLQIQNKFEEHYINLKDFSNPRLDKMSMSAILEGTKYYTGSNSFDCDIFAGISETDIKPINITKSLF